MKKRLEAELISIAHRILKLKNKSEVDDLYRETQKLYHVLSVLKFYGDNYENLKSEISETEIEEKISESLDEKPIEVELPIAKVLKNEFIEEKPIEETEEIEEEPIIVGEIVISEDEIDEDEVEDESFEDNDVVEKEDKEDHEGTLKEIATFTPAFELSHDDEIEDEIEEKVETKIDEPQVKIDIDAKPISKQMTLEEILGDEFKDPIFVKPNELSDEKVVSIFEEKKETLFEEKETKVVSLNDSIYKSITVSLNDRVAFVKHLFNESDEDYNRVLSQLNTFDTFDEAKEFINDMVIPDYNYWVGKEEYLERFMEIVEKKFV